MKAKLILFNQLTCKKRTRKSALYVIFSRKKILMLTEKKNTTDLYIGYNPRNTLDIQIKKKKHCCKSCCFCDSFVQVKDPFFSTCFYFQIKYLTLPTFKFS